MILLSQAQEFINLQDTHKMTALHHAVELDCVDIVRMLLEHGALVSVLDGQERSCLHLAAHDNRVDIARVSHKNEYEVDQMDNL
jgi:ankyrin repeat protein